MSEGYDEEWVAFEKVMGKPELPEDPVALREKFNESLVQLSKLLPPTDTGIITRDERVSPHVTARVYTPPAAGKEKLPLIVFCHGGGWLAGNLDTEDHMCRTMCSQISCIVVSLEYRLYPSVKFPDPFEDCYAGFQWAYENADDLGADKQRYSIMGGSAGAALAIAVVHKLVSSGRGDHVAGLVMMSGMFLHPDKVPSEYQHLHKSYVENGGKVPIVTGDNMLWAFEEIVGAPGTSNVDWFPIVGAAQALRGFPSTYIINMDREACRDDGRVLEEALKDANVPVKRDNMPGLPHYFWCFPIEKAGARFRENLIDGIKWMIGTH